MTAPVSYTMLQMLRKVKRCGALGLLMYRGRTLEALERRELVVSSVAASHIDRLVGRCVYRLTDAGRALLS